MNIKRYRNKYGQVIQEWVFLLVVVITAVSAMTIYVKRALQARMYDANNYMVQEASSGAPDINLDSSQYEPYYTVTSSRRTETVNNSITLSAGGTSGIFHKIINERTQNVSTSTQLPPSAGAEEE